MTKTTQRLIGLFFAVAATFALQGTMLAGFDNLAQAGQEQMQARAAAAACTATNIQQPTAVRDFAA